MNATYDGQTMRIYFNGDENASAAATASILSNLFPVTAGGQIDVFHREATRGFFSGILDEPRIQGRVWTSSEISNAKLQFDLIATYTYDNNGNRLTRTTGGITQSNRYNADGLLTQIQQSTIPVGQYVYDAEGRRVNKTSVDGTTFFFGKDFELRPGNVKVTHIFSGAMSVADIIQDGSTTQTYYPHINHLNSTSLVTDSNGQVVQQIQYQPFGETALETGSSPIHRKYTSQEQDTESNLYDYGARHYDPKTGTFISVDPALLNKNSARFFDPKNLSAYAYCNDNPMKNIDPDGREPVSLTILGLTAIAAVGIDYYSQYKQSGMSFSNYYMSGQYSLQRAIGEMGLGAAMSAGGAAIGALEASSWLGTIGKGVATSGLFSTGYAVEKTALNEDITIGGLLRSSAAGFGSFIYGKAVDWGLKSAIGTFSIFDSPAVITKDIYSPTGLWGAVVANKQEIYSNSYQVGAAFFSGLEGIADKWFIDGSQPQLNSGYSTNFSYDYSYRGSNNRLDLNYRGDSDRWTDF